MELLGSWRRQSDGAAISLLLLFIPAQTLAYSRSLSPTLAAAVSATHTLCNTTLYPANTALRLYCEHYGSLHDPFTTQTHNSHFPDMYTHLHALSGLAGSTATR